MLRPLTILVCSAVAFAQTPQFEAASLKLLDRPMGRPSFRINPGRVDAHIATLLDLLERAYSVGPYQIDLSHSMRGRMPLYDLTATMQAGTSTEQMRQMLRALLETRLKLKVHREPRDVAVYVVTIARSGLRIHASQNPPAEDAPYHSADIGPDGWRFQDKMPLSRLWSFLQPEVDRPLVDQAGLQGFYDIDLRWPRQEPVSAGPILPPPDPANMASLFSSMEKQLGLKVEAKKLPVEMLVIDSFVPVPMGN